MSDNIDKCEHLQKLHDRLVEEIRVLKEDLQAAEEEGVNPIETVSIVKSLQKALGTITVELAKCHG
ncbi:hypothetical protein [Dictyobacter formicarum]|uniref:Uncharacterized protein n=1 Tax=Dictyobacter formicarum TaxID=2778368 RepID=A0ABQ3VP38_9CHLR|nr:hypothetical protein [Dictyobacter formicarum]GHO87429.1 hypothetical protein KSZ_54350 [Dictyobacter formicarum]